MKHYSQHTRQLSWWGCCCILRHSPRFLGRPESTDFIGCFPLRSLRCQQQKNKIVAMVPSKSSNNSNTHWILYGLNSTKNAAAIIIRRDVGQLDPATPDRLLSYRFKRRLRMRIKTPLIKGSHRTLSSGHCRVQSSQHRLLTSLLWGDNTWLSTSTGASYFFIYFQHRKSQQKDHCKLRHSECSRTDTTVQLSYKRIIV